MRKPKIHLKRIGYSNSILLVNGSNSIIVDTGVKGNLHQLKAMLKQYNLKPEDIRLIILTHTHYDHTGNLKELKKWTGAKVLVHQNEFENLKNGYIPIPRGQRFYTRFVSELGRKYIPDFASPDPFTADIINKDKFDLSEYELNARIISTPGHSAGSQSVVFDKTVIAGDTFNNLIYGVIFPHFAENPQLLIKTWHNLFDLGIEEIYPGHGSKFHVKVAIAAAEKWKKKLKMEV